MTITEAMKRRASRSSIMTTIGIELDRAYAKHGNAPWSRHEFYAILLEEVDELWEAIKKDRPISEVTAEAIEVASMCVRYLETGGTSAELLEIIANEKHEKLRLLREAASA